MNINKSAQFKKLHTFFPVFFIFIIPVPALTGLKHNHFNFLRLSGSDRFNGYPLKQLATFHKQ